jgi:hypothetical protein
LVNQVLVAANAFGYYSEGKLKLKSKTMESFTNGANTYLPNVTPIYDLGGRAQGADFLAGPGEAPVSVDRVAGQDRPNCFPIEYTSRASSRVAGDGQVIVEPNNEYRKATFDGVAEPNDALVRGTIKAPVSSLPVITRKPHAEMLSRLLANQSIYRASVYRFRLGWRFALLEVGDLVTITEANLGLSRALVRVKEIAESQDGFDIVAESVGYAGTVPSATYTVT